jgi:hypothetical protein
VPSCLAITSAAIHRSTFRTLVAHEASEPHVRWADATSRQPRIVDIGIPPSIALKPSVVSQSDLVVSCSLIGCTPRSAARRRARLVRAPVSAPGVREGER